MAVTGIRRALRACVNGASLLALLGFSAGAAAAPGTFLAFTPDPALEAGAGALSPEGCIVEAPTRGSLVRSSAATTCHSGQWGPDVSAVTACGGVLCQPTHEPKARFETPPLEHPLVIGGTAGLVVYYVAGNENRLPTTAVPYPDAARAHVEYTLEDVPPGALSTFWITGGRAVELNPGGAGGVYRGEAHFEVPSYTVPSGHRLRVTITSTLSPDGRLLFGGAPLASNPIPGARESYHDAGITFQAPAKADDGPFGGALPAVLVAVMSLLVLIRRRANASRRDRAPR
jgi:hypothetical protein